MNEWRATESLSGAGLPGLARQSVADALAQSDTPPPRGETGWLAEPHPVFVTLRTTTGQLRGCVGTFHPKFRDMVEETWHIARQAAFTDTRFTPVKAAELPELRFEVSVLGECEPVASEADLDPARYGVIVRAADGRVGLLLPALPGIETVAQQLELARRKAGIGASEPISIERFETMKFAET